MGTSGKKTIEVGILSAPCIAFQLEGNFGPFAGAFEATVQNGVVCVTGKEGSSHPGQQAVKAARCIFEPSDENMSFVLKDVVIGIEFHWERKEDQRFKGALVFVPEDGQVRAVNVLSVEDYLVSVIASEMSATSMPEYLKAHAVISRSWVLSQMKKRERAGGSAPALCRETAAPSEIRTDAEWIKWWDREDHTLFDVCADDHCQRYQGITRPSQSLDNVSGAIKQTAGEVLTSDGEICDARFSKCCGGIMERFSTCWEAVDPPYLQGKYDGEDFPAEIPLPDLTDHAQAEVWIESTPPAFCNTDDTAVLSQVLNDYDQETKAFYRWEVSYTSEELGDLIKNRIGEDLGCIEDLIPLERGSSGRISKLKIIGSKRTLTIGKELLIRKALSPTHLYSSAFVPVKRSYGFVLYGAGWGHGVGLCQIGGAVMASRGYSYKEILAHYYPGSRIEKLY
ncbi:MAG: SpoIID/LytB domain-containing protein [Bacteroidales bacterium]|jgi:stage II sporulation protein D|nr:SpoIID/LytB domain-containing protein [Bacteroidales bacterium]HKM31252.1 SpoIID/LytB domain-containing protein [Bacteroidales bacterium]HPX79803.1 SpoIID/LytB domain-containing protein [Bacteroidales bacterium]